MKTILQKPAARVFILTLIIALASTRSYASLSGAYTINGSIAASSTNYKTFASAISDMISGTRADAGPINGTGVSGPVTFTVAAGTYAESPNITAAITGASAVNTITFDGGTGNATTRVIQNTGNIFVITGASYIKIKNLTMTCTGTSGAAVEFIGTALGATTAPTNDKLLNCICNAAVFAGTGFSSWCGVSFSGTFVGPSVPAGFFANDTVIGCTINNGQHGLAAVVSGPAVGNGTGMYFANNTISNFNQDGMDISGDWAVKVKGNTISSNSPSFLSIAILLSNCGQSGSDFTELSGNIVQFIGRFGVELTNCVGTSTYPNEVYNNFIGGREVYTTSTVGHKCMVLATSSFTNFWFNSINLEYSYTATVGGDVGFDDVTAADANLDIRNNIFACTTGSTGGVGGIPFYCTSTAPFSAFDNNIFYTNFNNAGTFNEATYLGTTYTSVTGVSSGTYNLASFVVNPSFKSQSDFHLSSSASAKLGVSLPTTPLNITTDIDGETRPATPHIGADDFPTPAANDLAVTAVVSPVVPFTPGTNTLTVTVNNVGTNTVTSANIYYTLNGATVGPLSLGVSLTTGQSTNFTFPVNPSFNVGGSAIKIFTSSPNGTTDSYNRNDTLSTTLYSLLNGTYTLNNTISASSTNFASFASAAAALDCGITNVVTGPVVINIAANTYNEQIELDLTSGTSATNTVTFNGGSASSVTLQYASTYGNQHTIRLNGATYITFKNMTITTTSSSYGWPVHFFGNFTNFITFSHCKITVPSSNGENLVPIAAIGQLGIIASINSGGNLAAFNKIDTCTITGGSIGIDWYGTGDAVNCAGNIFQGNTITGNSTYGISLQATCALKVLNNIITLNAGSGVWVYNCSSSSTATPDFIDISGNNITGVTGGQSYYGGIACSGVTGTTSLHTRLSNNTVVVPGTAANALCIDFSNVFSGENAGPSYADVSFNTLVYTGTGAGYCMFGWGGPINSFTDNIVAVMGGSGASYPMQMNSGSSITSMDYNTFYNTYNSNVYYDGSTTFTFANIIGADGFNTNSQAGGGVAPGTNPNFVGSGNYHITSQCPRGTPIAGITTDIDGDTRTTPPCMGSDDIAYNGVAAAGTIVGSASVCQGQTSVSYSVPTIAGATTYNWTLPTGASFVGASTNQSITVNFSPTASSGNVTVYGSTVCGTGTVSPNFGVLVNLIPSLSSSLTPPNICTGTAFSYTPTSATSGCSFAWSRSVVGGISNGANSGSNNPNEILNLTAPTGGAVGETYTYTTTAPNTCSNVQTVTFTVNNLPTVAFSTLPTVYACGGGGGGTITATGAVTYVWAPTATLSSSTGASVIASPVSNTTYTVIGTNANSCSNSNTAAVAVVPAGAPLAGNYTIDNTIGASSTNYTSFTSAVEDLNCRGVSANVTFTVKAGATFKEQAVLCAYTNPGAFAITFQKASGADPVLQGKAGAGAADAVFTLSGGSNYTFNGIDFADDSTDNLALGGGNSYMDFGLYINATATNGCSNNTYENGTITLSSAAGETYCVFVNNTIENNSISNNNNIIDNNILQYALNGVYFFRTNISTTTMDVGNQVSNNKIQHITNRSQANIGFEGIFAYGQQNMNIFNNQVYQINLVTTINFNGIVFAGAGNPSVSALTGASANIYGNTIGGTTANTITLTCPSGNSGGFYTGIAVMGGLTNSNPNASHYYYVLPVSDAKSYVTIYNNNVDNVLISNALGSNQLAFNGIIDYNSTVCPIYNNIVQNVTTYANYGFTGISNGNSYAGSNGSHIIYGNTISNITINAAGLGGASSGILTGGATYNNYVSLVTNSYTNAFTGVSGGGNVYGNTVVSLNSTNTGAITGINGAAGANVYSNAISSISGTSSGAINGITTGNGSNNIYGNTVSTITSGGAFTGISAGTTPNAGTTAVSNNTISGATAVGIIIGITGTSSTTTGTINISGNTISTVSTSANVAVTGIVFNPALGNCYGNSINNLGATGSGSNGAIIGINSTITAAIGASASVNINNNSLTGIYNTAGNGPVTGISFTDASVVNLTNIYQNTISTIHGDAVGNTNQISGIVTSSVKQVVVYQNYINNIYTLTTGVGLAVGIQNAGISTTSGNYYYNNFIYNIAAIKSTLVTLGGGAKGFYNSPTTGLIKVFYNSIFLNEAYGASAGVSSAFYTGAVTTASGVDLRNNILVNNPTGSFAKAYAFWWNATTFTGLATTTTNNFLYAAGSTGSGYIFNANATAGTTAQTNAAYRTSIGNTRGDFTTSQTIGGPNAPTTVTTTGDITKFFVTSTNLHLQPLSPAPGAIDAITKATAPISFTDAASVSRTLTDIDGDARNNPSTIGADEPCSTPANPSAFTASTTTACQGQNGVVYTVTNVAGAIFTWTVSAGATITSGQTTNSITVNYAANCASPVSVSVSITNGCGASATPTSASVTVNSIITTAGTLSGNASVCQSGTGTYSTPLITGAPLAANYNWVYSGSLGTGGSISSTTIGVSTASVTITFGSNATSGNVSVNGTTSCGNGPSVSFPVTVNPLPVAAGTITGASPVCQGQSGATFSVPTITNATSYNWTFPWGTTTTALPTVATNVPTNAVAGNVTVQGANSCGNGTVSGSFAVSVNPLPVTPGTISGPPNICSSTTGAAFSVGTVSGATGYVWTLPSGGTIITGATTNAITANFSGAISGNVTVAAVNACGNSATPSSLLMNVGLTGTYVIDGSVSGAGNLYPNTNVFTSFGTAISAMTSCGISGPVTFNVNAGTGSYNETPTVPAITGASSTNTITFDGGAGNAATRIITNTNGNYVVQFNGCSYVTFKNLTINNTTTGGNNAGCVWFNGATVGTPVTNCKLQNCNINSGFFASTGFAFWYATYFSSSAGSTAGGYFTNDTITGCTIYGGEHGISCVGVSGSQPTGMVFSNNNITNFYQYGIFCSTCAAPKIKSNYLNSSTNFGASFSINIASCIPSASDFTEVSGNQIPSFVRGGIFVSADIANATYPTTIYNNFLGGINNNNSSAVGVRGIYLNGAQYVRVWFNSINLNNISSSTTAGTNVGLSDPLGTTTNLDIRDNIISYNPTTGSGVNSTCIPFYYGSANIATNVINFDYNIFYTNYNNGGTFNIAYINGVSYTSANIIGALGFNSHSFFANPNFISPTNLHIQNATYGKLGVSLPPITTDIDGETRPGTPHIGADDFPPAGATDLSVSLVTAPTSPFPPGANNIAVLVTNVGTSTVTSGNIYYKLNGVTTGPLSLAPINLASGASTSFTFPSSANFNVGGNTIKVFTSLPNGVADTYTGNDTVTTTLYTWLNSTISGPYTINGGIAASATNFISFTSAANALDCGVVNVVQGPVTINVAPATYTEQFEIDAASGTSAANTVTFNGGSAASVTVQYAGTYGNAHTIRLKGCTYINFINMTITTTSSSYGWPVHFYGNGSNYNRFYNCNINVPSYNGESLVPVMFTGNLGLSPSIIPGGCLAGYNRIDTCAINKGSVGIDIYGTGDQVNCVENILQGNTITNATTYGISLSSTYATKVLNNTVTMPNSGSGIMCFGSGISTTPTPDFLDISKNVVTGFTGGQSFFGGICGSPICGSSATHNRVSNNIVVSSSLANGGICVDFENGFVNESPYCNAYTDFDFNTLVYTGTGAGYCFYNTNYQMADNNTFMDNIVAVTSVSGTSQPMNDVQTSNLTSCDYNIFYNASNGNAFNNGGTQYTLANVVGNGGFNVHSQAGTAPGTNPNFINAGAGNYRVSSQSCAGGIFIAGITTDIDGNARPNSPVPPTIGASEIPLYPANAGTITGTTPICQGQSGTTFSVPAITGAIGYIWTLPSGASIVSGSNTRAITVNFSSSAATGSQNVTVKGTNACGSGSSSPVYVMQVNPLPTAAIAGTISLCQNASSPNVTFTGNAGTAPYTFTYNINGGSNQTITSGTGTNPVSVTLAAPTGVVGTYAYNLVSVHDASSTSCSQSQSGTATVTINALPIAVISGTLTGCLNPGVVLGTFGSSAGSGSINGYQWKNTGGNINGATASTYSIPSAGTSNYSVVVSNTNGCSTTSSTSSVTAYSNPTPSITEADNSGLANNDGIICNLDAATLTANPSGLTYSWSAGLGTNQVETDNPSVTTTYTVTVTDGNNCTATTSNTVTVNQLPPLVVTPNNAVCTGGTTATLVASGASTYTWSPTTNLTPSAGTTATETAQISALTIYTVTGTGTNGCSINTQVPVATVAVGGTISAPFSIICSGTTKPLSVIGAAGHDYQWQISTDNLAWTNITGATSTTYTTAGSDGTTNKFYRLLAQSNSCWNVASTTAEVDVSVPTIPVTATGITDNSLTLNWSPVGTGNYTISYSGPTSATLTSVTPSKTITGLTANGTYSITVTQTGLACAASGTITGVTTLCAMPTGVTLSSPASSQILVSWTGVGGADYRVYYRPLFSYNTYFTKDVSNASSVLLKLQGNNNLYASTTYEVYVSRLDCPTTGALGQGTSPTNVTTLPTVSCATPSIDSVRSLCPVQIEVFLHPGSSPTNNYNIYIQRITPTILAVNSYGVTGNYFTINVPYSGDQFLIAAESKCTGGGLSALYVWPGNLTIKPLCSSLPNLVLSNPTCHGFTASWNADPCLSNSSSGYELDLRVQGTLGYNSYGAPLPVAPVGPNKLVNWATAGRTYQVFVRSIYNCNGYVTYGPASQTLSITTLSSGCRDEETNQPEETKPAAQQYAPSNDEVFTLYPNPNNGEFVADLSRYSNEEDAVRIEVINLIGQTIMTHLTTISGGHMSEFINLPTGTAAGTYIVRLTAGKNVYTAKINVSK